MGKKAKGSYRPINMEKTKKHYQERKGFSDFLKLNEGVNTLRFLSAYNDDGDWYKEVAYHYGVGVNRQHLVCLRSFGKRCYVCEKVEELMNHKNPDVQKTGENLKAKWKVYFNVVDRDNEKKGVQVYGAPSIVFNEVLGLTQDEDYGDITHPEKGFDVRVKKTGKGLMTKYAVRPRPKATSLGDDSWLDEINDLDTIFHIKSYEEQKAIYGGVSADDADDSDNVEVVEEEKKPAKTKKAKPKKEEVVEVVEVDDDMGDDMDDGDFEEEEKKPAKTKKDTKPVEVDDDDDDIDDDDDDIDDDDDDNDFDIDDDDDDF